MPFIQFTGGQTAVPHYPSDGIGGFTTTAADSLVLDWEETRLSQFDIPAGGATQTIEIYHGERPVGTTRLAFKTFVGTQNQLEKLTWPDGGLLLQGAWYILFTGTTAATSYYHVTFERVGG